MRKLTAAAAAIVAVLIAGPSPAGAGTEHPARARAAQTSLQQALATQMRLAGTSSSAYAVDLTTGNVLYSLAAAVPRLPASVEKLYTTSTALLRFGPGARLSTAVYGTGSMGPNGVWNGNLYLRGGGDPTFGSAGYDRYAYGGGATMQRLVTNLRHATGIQAVHGAIVGDESYLDSRRGTPATGYKPSVDVEGELSGLVYDRGLADPQGSAYQNHPALFATQAFVAALRAAGVKVPGSDPVHAGITPPSATSLTTVGSPPISTLIRWTNTPSDNFFAETLLKDLGARFGGAGTTAAGARVVKAEVAANFGVYPALDDGSGLSYNDRTSPIQVESLLAKMAGNQAFVNSLAVAGETGTLQYEMNGTVAQGRCRGKTGTLAAVSNLVGYCTAQNGDTIAFAFLMNAVDPTYAHPLQNAMAEALAGYTG